jgi:hypothetical protein
MQNGSPTAIVREFTVEEDLRELIALAEAHRANAARETGSLGDWDVTRE